ncbi:hypothetical protein HYY69_03255 [Candidatus Woesearchaeota archaeon]|nr:hypothetical protein [Candidatus Woesearchaeota archaeon]
MFERISFFMDRSFKEELNLSFWRRLTGRQDPTLLRKITSILLAAFFLFLTFYLGFYFNIWMTDYDVNANFEPYIKDKLFLPIIITNGPKEVTNASISIKTCYMDNYEEYSIGRLIEGQEYNIEFVDNETVYVLGDLYTQTNFQCNPTNISTGAQCWIKTYKVDGMLYIPEQQCKKYKCGYCSYELLFISNQLSKNFSGSFPAPVEIPEFTMKVSQNRVIDSNSTLEEYAAIGLSIFSYRDLCLLNAFDNQTLCNQILEGDSIEQRR